LVAGLSCFGREKVVNLCVFIASATKLALDKPRLFYNIFLV
jgi:hypothetical protein